MANSAESNLGYGPQPLSNLLGSAIEAIKQASPADAGDGELVQLLGEAIPMGFKRIAADELDRRYPGSMTGLFDNSRTSRP